MLVTQKKLYTELNRIMEIFGDLTNLVGDHQVVIIKRDREIKADITDIKERINYTLQKVIDLTDRVEALETKKQHRTIKKQTKKTKGK